MCNLQKENYFAFGLQIESEWPLPELVHGEEAKKADVTIKVGDLTNEWERHEKESNLVITEGHVMFKIDHTATYVVKGGHTIIVSPEVVADERKVRLFLLGTCMGIILMQRNILPLHGSAVLINDQVYAIVGDSGAGKSTLASALIKQGYRLLSDDVIAVSLDEDNIPIVSPAYPQQKLWQKSLDYFGEKSDCYSAIFARETKYAVPVHESFHTEPQRLAGVFELTMKKTGEVRLSEVESLDRLRLLGEHTYRQYLLEPLGLLEWHFMMTSRLLRDVRIFRIERPENVFTAHIITKEMERMIGKEDYYESEKHFVN